MDSKKENHLISFMRGPFCWKDSKLRMESKRAWLSSRVLGSGILLSWQVSPGYGVSELQVVPVSPLLATLEQVEINISNFQ